MEQTINDEPNAPPLLRLPPETRQLIYEYMLISPEQPVYLLGPLAQCAAALFLTCKLVRSESITIFLSQNTFSLTGTLPEYHWLRRIEDVGRQELRKIIYKGERSWSHDQRFFNTIARCERLELVIAVSYNRMQELSILDRKGFKNMHGFARATATDVGDGAQWIASPGYLPSQQSLNRRTVAHFLAPCPKSCRVHDVTKGGVREGASVHIENKCGRLSARMALPAVGL